MKITWVINQEINYLTKPMTMHFKYYKNKELLYIEFINWSDSVFKTILFQD